MNMVHEVGSKSISGGNVILSRTTEDVGVNKVYEKVKMCTNLTITHKNLIIVEHPIRIMSTTQEDIMSVVYHGGAEPLLAAEFKSGDIKEVKNGVDMYSRRTITVTLTDGLTLEFR